MNSRLIEVSNRHTNGYNCAQAVACAYCDLAGIDEKTTFKMTEALGLGMGSMKGTCGAVSGACAILGLISSNGDFQNPTTKQATYALSRELSTKFQNECGSLVCEELKGVSSGKMLMSCPKCIEKAATLLEDILKEKNIEL